MLNADPTLALFTDLLVPSLSANEGQVRAVVCGYLEELGYTPEKDAAGNVYVRLAGKHTGRLYCFAAHMDEIGMVVEKIESDGTLRLMRCGGLHPWKLGEGPVDIYGDTGSITGVLSMGSTHTQNAADQAITWKDVKVITGLTPEQLDQVGVRAGVPVLPTRERRGPIVFGDPTDPMVGAWTFDDRLGVVVLLQMLTQIKEEAIVPHFPTVIAFTTREEIGGHGAKYLARTLSPEVFVSVDGSPIPPGSPLVLDGRPTIWSKDRIAQYDPELLRAFSQAAITAGTQLQPAVFDSAASDAGLVSYALGVPRIVCVGHVRENSHGFEVVRFSVFKNLLNTLSVFIKTWQG